MVLRRTGRAALVMLAALVCGCGKKGPPLPPLNLVPDRPANTAGRVAGDTVYLSITVPSKNANGRGALALDHLEIYAVTVDAGATVPPNRELLTKAHAIASIPIKPPADPDEAPDETAPPDTRPGGGDKIVFAEHLTGAQTTPEVMAKPSTAATPAPQGSAATAAPGAAGMSTPTVPPLTSPESVPATGGGGGVVGVPSALPQTPATESATSGGEEPETSSSSAPGAPPQAASPAAAAPPSPAATVTRVYVIRGVTKKGHPGTPSARVVVPIVSPPPPPSNVSAEFGETSVTIKWSAPEAPAGRHAPFAYNVYAYSKSQPGEAPPPLVSMPPPLNPQPIDTLALEHGGAEPGKEQCFVVRTVETIASTSIESEPSPPVCVTPVDRFAPEAPTGLAAVATTGAMNLIWDANHEPDVAGYLVLRAESPGDTLQPLTPEPIRETRFRDTTAQPGVRYAYVIVAVDRAGNRSAPSARVEETAR